MSKDHSQTIINKAITSYLQSLKEEDREEIKKITAEVVSKDSLELHDSLFIIALNPGDTQLIRNLLNRCSQGDSNIDFILNTALKAQLIAGASDAALLTLKLLKQNFNLLPSVQSIKEFNNFTVAKFIHDEFATKTSYFSQEVVDQFLNLSTTIGNKLVTSDFSRALILEYFARDKGLDISKTYNLNEYELASIVKKLPSFIDKISSFNLLNHDGSHHTLLHCEKIQGEYIFLLGDSMRGNYHGMSLLKENLPKEFFNNSFFFGFDLQRQHSAKGCMFFALNDLEVILKHPDLIQKLINSNSKKCLANNRGEFKFSHFNKILTPVAGTEKFMKLAQGISGIKTYIDFENLDDNLAANILKIITKERDGFGVHTPVISGSHIQNCTADYVKGKYIHKLAQLLNSLNESQVEKIVADHSLAALLKTVADMDVVGEVVENTDNF